MENENQYDIVNGIRRIAGNVLSMVHDIEQRLPIDNTTDAMYVQRRIGVIKRDLKAIENAEQGDSDPPYRVTYKNPNGHVETMIVPGSGMVEWLQQNYPDIEHVELTEQF